MFPCCTVGSGVSKSQAALLQEKLLLIQPLFPGSSEFLLLDGRGRLMLHCGHAGAVDAANSLARGLPQLQALRQAMSSLGGAMQTHSCPALHTKGIRSMLSCYCIGADQLLVVSCTASPLAIELLDLGIVDLQIATTLVQVHNILEDSGG
mmetsp:Transcript_29337/g.82734  ORF Transcript_29337/g.82734 Transcript_29337/m.82734 type:complete len:150 (+) Transcript_29337:90-539(+)